MKIYLYSLMFIIAALQGGLCDDTPRNKELNDAMAERAELMIKSHKAQEKLNRAWSDKNLESPEIKKLRERYQKLHFEMVEVREKLKAEVKKLPQVQKQEQDVEIMHAKEKALAEKIEKLKNK